MITIAPLESRSTFLLSPSSTANHQPTRTEIKSLWSSIINQRDWNEPQCQYIQYEKGPLDERKKCDDPKMPFVFRNTHNKKRPDCYMYHKSAHSFFTFLIAMSTYPNAFARPQMIK
mmetsp:Transcript_21272/g.61035  ORF Transcript_21272/g.61035 Transcript_21272/m.61035 type:complete len:116 (-) Transcript_21272:811-1158(-)